MKKHLIAAAVAAAVAAPAMAQVTVGGGLDTSYTSKTGTITGSASGSLREDGTRLSSATQTRTINAVDNSFWSTSNINFKGTEDLGNGIKAMFHVEGAVVSDTGSSDLANRVTQVGVSGAFGTVMLGRGSTALNDYATSAGHGIGNFANLPYLATGRPNNSVNYITPSFNGISARVTIGEGEDLGSTTKSNGDYTAASIQGSVGNFSFAVGSASEDRKRKYTAGRAFVFNRTNNTGGLAGSLTGAVSEFVTDQSTGLFGFTAAGLTSLTPASSTVNNTLLANLAMGTVLLSATAAEAAVSGKVKDDFVTASYNFGPATLRGQYLRSKSSGTVADGNGIQTIDSKIMAFTLTAPVGASTFFVNFQDHDMSGGRQRLTSGGDYSILGTTDRSGDKATILGLGVNHALSKRTSVYAVTRNTDNDTQSKMHSGVAGKNARTTAIGVRHSF